MTKRIIQIVLAVVIVCLIYVIYKQISTPIIFAKEKAAREARVIDRIKDIRTAERSFKTKYNRFTGDFDTLINFVLTDSLEFERKIVDEDDSVAMAQLKKSGRKNSEKVWVHVIDTIFTPKKAHRRTGSQPALRARHEQPDGIRIGSRSCDHRIESGHPRRRVPHTL